MPLDQGDQMTAAVATYEQSGSPGALLRRGPLRTGLAAFTASRLKQASGARGLAEVRARLCQRRGTAADSARV